VKKILSRFVSKELPVAADQLRAAYSSHKRTWLAPVALFLCLIGVTHSAKTAGPLILVGIAYCFLVIFNHRQVAATLEQPLTERTVSATYASYLRTFICLGLLGATLPWLVLHEARPESVFALTAIILGYSIGLAFVHSAFPPAVIAFLVPVSTSVCLFWIINKPPWAFELVVFQIFFLALVIRSAITYSTTIRTAIERLYQINQLATRSQETATSLVDALQKLRDANTEKQRIFSAANHDLRQPLSSLSALVAVLDRRIEKLRLEDEGIPLKEVTDKIDHSISVLVKTVDSLGELNQLDSGAIVAHPSLFELAGFLRDVASDFDPLLAASKASIRIDVAQKFIFSDPLILSRIVRNLIQNALVHAKGSSIDFSLGENSTGALSLSIADHGPGIDTSRWADVMEEYVQLDNPERSSKKGFGLGLSIVRRLSTLLNMPLELAQTPGGGLTIYIDLSRQISTEVSSEYGSAAGRASSRKYLGATVHRFVVVEDEIDVGESYRLLIEEMGGSVVLFKNAKAALESKELATATHALLDNWLPDMPGTELAKRLHKDYPALVIAIMSGDTVGSAREEALRAGFRFAAKPVSEFDILALSHLHGANMGELQR
jgi:two-component system, sensor histidine kinase